MLTCLQKRTISYGCLFQDIPQGYGPAAAGRNRCPHVLKGDLSLSTKAYLTVLHITRCRMTGSQAAVMPQTVIAALRLLSFCPLSLDPCPCRCIRHFHNHSFTPYLSSSLHRIADMDSRRRLRSSADTDILLVPRSRLVTIGDRSIPVTGPRTWNNLPVSIRSAQSLLSFKRQL